MSQNTFLSQSEDVKTSYLIILGAVSTADSENTPEEVAFMEQMATVAGLSDANKARVAESIKNSKGINMGAELANFKNHDLKYSLVTDLLNLSYADGELNNNEVAQIKNVTGILSISDEQFEALKQYVQAANKEASTSAGNAELNEKGEVKEQKTNFLDKIGLSGTFKKLGIPTENFLTGSTIAAVLTSAAFMLLKNYAAKSGQQGGTADLGATVGNLIGSFFGGGGQQQTTTQNQGSSIAGMVTGFFTSQTGQATINSLLGNVMKATSQGKGLGNLMDILGGGKNQQTSGLQSILGAFMK